MAHNAHSCTASYWRSPREGEDPERLVADRPLALAAEHGADGSRAETHDSVQTTE